MKILHSADWHLDSPLGGFSEEQAKFLRAELLRVPDRVTALCKSENCDLLLLAGDLFDGQYTKDSLNAVKAALEEVKIPVFISPGNHDFCRPDSPYLTETWPENVHIFTHAAIESVTLPELDCKIYGAGYTAMDCPALLKHFSAEGDERWHIGLLHSDPLQAGSPYAPVTTQQVKSSGLDYLALGHIHKGDSFRAGEVLCAWPGAPMGRGYDEAGVKGVLVVELEDTVSARFLPLNTPRFFDETVDAGEDALEAVADRAVSRGIGARGLRAVLEEVMTKVMYDVPSDPTIVKVTIHAPSVTDGAVPELVRDPERVQRPQLGKAALRAERGGTPGTYVG